MILVRQPVVHDDEAVSGHSVLQFHLRNAGIALSLANLVYLRVWAELITFDAREGYWIKTPPQPVHFAAAMVNVVLLAAVFFLMLCRGRSRGSVIRKLAPFPLALILATLVNTAHTLVGDPGASLFLRFVEQRFMALAAAVAIACTAAYLIAGVRVLRFAAVPVLLLLPMVPLTFLQATWKAAHSQPRYRDKSLAPRLSGLPPRRALWIIFDEWDYQLSFPERPASVRLPELDRFRGTALFATDAYTANMNTDWSMPALTTGLPVAAVNPTGPDDLSIRFAGPHPPALWSQLPNVFSRVRQMGINTGVVGWALPYCRVLASSLTDCEWWSGSNQFNSTGFEFPPVLLNQPRSLFETVYRSPFGQPLSARRHSRILLEMLERALQAANRRDLGLVLVHLPVPHPPYVYDSRRRDFSYGSTPLLSLFTPSHAGYLPSLELLDSIVGDLRRSMQSAGTWDTSAILLSADHPFRHRRSLDGRPTNLRVPFLLKLPGQHAPLSYRTPFNALLTHDLLLDLLRARIANPQELAAWLDRHHDAAPLRYDH